MSRDRFPINRMNKEAQQNTQHSRELALGLLSRPEYARYKEASNKEVADLLNTIRNYKNTDPIQYAFYIQAKIKELNEREWLVKQVEADAGVLHEKN